MHIKFHISIHKIFDNMLTDGLKFQGEEKRRKGWRDSREIRSSSTVRVPWYKHEARVKEKRLTFANPCQQSYAQHKNSSSLFCLLVLERPIDFTPCDKYRNNVWVDNLCQALATRPSSRGRGWQRRSAHPPRQWDQPQMWTEAGELKKNDIKSEKVVTKTKSRFLAKPRELEGF